MVMAEFDENTYQSRFNTPLPASMRSGFRNWATKNGYRPEDEMQDYDIQGAYLQGVQQSSNGHLTDQFKKPNHPTFSEQSQYSGVRGAPTGGHWDVPDQTEQAIRGTRPSFTMSEGMLRDDVPVHNPDNLRQYLNTREFGTDLLLPRPPYRQAGLRRP